MHSDREKLVEHLKVRLKLKYAANCKCGSCQCVPIADLHEAIAALSDPVKDEPVAWHRSTDGAGSILLYTLRQDGWRRGEPVMVNDAMVRVEAANGSQTPIEPIAERILSALTRPADERPAVAVEADRAKDDQYWSVVEQQANPEGDNARLREALTEIATLNRSRDQLQEMARSVLASPAPVPAEAVAPVGEWREVDLDHFLKGRRRSPAYFPATGEICEVSGPHCDDDNGYTWGQTAVLWQNDLFVLYGNKGFWPVLHKREHVLFRPVTPSASPAVQGGDHGE